MARVDRVADFFAAIGDAFASPSEVDAGILLKRFGAARLRRAEAATAFLLERLGRVWDVADPNVAPPVGPELAPDTTATLLSCHRRHLRTRGDQRTKPRTSRAYMDAARGLMEFAEADGRISPTARDVRRLLWRTPGARASLGSFLTWIEVTRELHLALPRRAPVDRRALERRRLKELSKLMLAMEAASAETPSRPALLAARMSRAFAAPLGVVLRLEVGSVTAHSGRTLKLDGLSVDVPARLMDPLQAMARAIVRAGLPRSGRGEAALGRVRPASHPCRRRATWLPWFDVPDLPAMMSRRFKGVTPAHRPSMNGDRGSGCRSGVPVLRFWSFVQG